MWLADHLRGKDVLLLAGSDAEARRQRPDGTWTRTFQVPRSHLARNAELAYAGNVYVAQGRTVDTAHLLVTDSLSRQAVYVGMTRGRESNTAHVVTGKTAPPGASPTSRQRLNRCSPVSWDATRKTCRPPGRSARPRKGRGNRPPAPPVVGGHQAEPVPRHRRADQGPAHRIPGLAVRPRALPSGLAAAAARRPACRARHRRPDRPAHRRRISRCLRRASRTTEQHSWTSC